MKGNSWVWLIAGIGIGAGSTYILATRGGRRLRRKIARQSTQLRDRLFSSGKDIVGRSKSLIDRGKQTGDQVRQFVESSGNGPHTSYASQRFAGE